MSCKSVKEQPKTIPETDPTPAYKQQMENLEQGIYFRATGNEPFWGLKLTESEIQFTSLKPGFESFNAPVVIPERAMDVNAKMYRVITAFGKMNVEIRQQSCTDNMSGIESPYVVTVNISKTGNTDFTAFNGCGAYITDSRLHDIWVLEKLNGVKVATTDFNREFPNLEINATTNQFMGFAGCNRMGGSIFFEKGLLRFSKIVTTEMACGSENKENEFLTALQSTTSYSVENLKLTLKNQSGVELVFKKVD